MAQRALTKQQDKLLEIIKDYIEKHGYSPTYTEMQVLLNAASVSSVQNLIKQLSKKGFITQSQGQCRTIKIVGREDKWTTAVPSSFGFYWKCDEDLNITIVNITTENEIENIQFEMEVKQRMKNNPNVASSPQHIWWKKLKHPGLPIEQGEARAIQFEVNSPNSSSE